MCITPRRLMTGVMTACHECWQCREHAVLDWVGRNIAESKTAKAANAITLTYGRNTANDADHERAVLLTYSDVQKYLKRLRTDGYPVRYFVTGEFGSRKGRAHWHIVQYWQKEVPEHVLDKNHMQEHWPHGWSYWTPLRPHTVKYNCKYILKDLGDAQAQGHLAMSKKPPLGAEYFQKRALQYVEQGLAPQDLNYTFPEAKQRNLQGGHDFMRFRLGGRSAELFLQGYIDLWERERGDKRRPKSDLVDRFAEYGRVVSDTLYETLKDGEMVEREKQAKRLENKGTGGIQWDRDHWWFRWVTEAPNEQERQRRQVERDVIQYFEREEQFKQWLVRLARNHPAKYISLGLADRFGPDPGGECNPGPLGGPQRDAGRYGPVDLVHGGRGVVQPVPGSGHDGLGPVGRYNRNYGTGQDGS